MHPFAGGASGRGFPELPLFPLNAVLFPGGRLPLRIFEQRYIAMAKSCLRDGLPFGVCRITRGDEVAKPQARLAMPEFAIVGTLATIQSWEMPQLGILRVAARGGSRFRVRSHMLQADGLIVADALPVADEPFVAVEEAQRPLAQLLELLAQRIGPELLPHGRSFGDASWVGFRLAELLPLPLSIKQSMLEMNDAALRLVVLRRFLEQHGLLQSGGDPQL